MDEKEIVTTMALIKIGVKCDLIGFSYLVKAVKLAIDDPNIIYSSQKMFKIIAENSNAKSPTRVEANMQNAINNTYDMVGFNELNSLFGFEAIRPEHKPTIAELVKLLAEYYLLKIYQNTIQPTNF
ncbi:MAG: hypothetical protein E7375_02585 [Clostridiales bacterium]|nr:hypothetical protein [Clostridiales bacterium]